MAEICCAASALDCVARIFLLQNMLTHICLCLVATVTAQTTWKDLHAAEYKYTLDQLVDEFNLDIAAEDRELRSRVLQKNLMKIRRHNAGDSSYKMGVNAFAHLTSLEFKDVIKGTSRSGVDTSNFAAADLSSHVHTDKLPSSLDWRDKGVVTPAKNRTLQFWTCKDVAHNLQQLICQTPKHRGSLWILLGFQRNRGKYNAMPAINMLPPSHIYGLRTDYRERCSYCYWKATGTRSHAICSMQS